MKFISPSRSKRTKVLTEFTCKTDCFGSFRPLVRDALVFLSDVLQAQVYPIEMDVIPMSGILRVGLRLSTPFGPPKPPRAGI